MRFGLAVAMRVLACLLWLAAAGLMAQEQVVHHEKDGVQVCTVRLVPYFGGTQTGGYGWVSVELRNHDRAPHRVALSLSSLKWSGHDLRSARELVLEPEAVVRFHWPVPTRSGSVPSLWAVCSIDGEEYSVQLDPSVTSMDAVLLLSDANDLQSMLGSVMAAQPRYGHAEPKLLLGRGQEAAADWRCYTGFYTVVVDGRMPLSNDLQDALRRYVFAGGRVLLLHPDALPPGPLRRAAEAGGEERREGLGRWGVARETIFDQRMLTRWLARGASPVTWPLAPWRQELQPIPGLGAAPVLLFLTVILAFAVLAGPVNFLFVRRLRRPLLLLLTVPALGLGTTLFLLLQGLWRDGLGVRGVVRSYSFLDQAQHEVAVIGDRTLFAGLSPGRLTLDADSLLVAPACFRGSHGERGTSPAFVVDWSRGTIDGGVLPSRTLTTLLSARQAAERARLRARLLPDGDLELLTDGDLKPIGAILWCDASGQSWCGEAPRLVRCDAPAAAAALRALRTRIAESRAEVGWEDAEDYDWRASDRRVRAREVTVARDLAQALLHHDEPEPGHWYGFVASAPWLPDHGLAVAYDLQEHFVIGRLAAEDVQR